MARKDGAGAGGKGQRWRPGMVQVWPGMVLMTRNGADDQRWCCWPEMVLLARDGASDQGWF